MLKPYPGWYRGEKRSMKFATPRIWREPDPSERVAHDLTRPVPEPPTKISQRSRSSLSSYKSNADKEFLPTPEQPKYNFITTEDYNDLIRDLNLPKSKAELLGPSSNNVIKANIMTI
ncbi:uncharacterized protein [Eurosta solidaginis]|uniref:uncharacterized protein isoform X2 n=1 Tax=Eurosta solidaginis TaxID=178769 RepID=UPI0035313391